MAYKQGTVKAIKWSPRKEEYYLDVSSKNKKRFEKLSPKAKLEVLKKAEKMYGKNTIRHKLLLESIK